MLYISNYQSSDKDKHTLFLKDISNWH